MNLTAPQLCFTKYCIEFHENPTNYLLNITTIRIDRRKDVVLTCDICLNFEKKA